MNLVRYCPGSAPGSPAHLSKHEADGYLFQDTRYVQLMARLGALNLPVVFPHIGECPCDCRYRREVQPC